MRLESALLNSRAGVASHGQAISVLSDNISNAETTGFKASRTEFSDLFSNFTGSKDSAVVKDGNGSRVTAVRPIFSNGEIITTNRALDAAIAGNGFFITGNQNTVANLSASTPGIQYTRAGNFQLDAEGFLITNTGRYVYTVDPAIPPVEGQAPALTRVNLTTAGVGATPTTIAQLQGNLSAQAEVKAVPAGPIPTFNDLNEQATAVQNIEVYDSLGEKRDVTLAFFKTANNTWTVNAYTDGANLNGGTAGTPTLIGTTNLAFEQDGTIAAANQAAAAINATPAWAGGAAAGAFAINLGTYNQFASPSVLSSFTQNGIGAGQINSYNFDADGRIFAQMSNGQNLVLGQLQVATFRNIDGLSRIGGNSFEATTNTGAINVGNPGAGTGGTLRGGALERSTTDLSNSFVDLVTIQRGYQANSQMLSAANELLQQTISMIR